MDLKDSLIKGGMLISHFIHEGKHHYEVENVVKFKKANRGKPFVRVGDKLVLINDINLQDLTPEELAQKLAEGNPMLTVLKAARIKQPPAESCPAEDALHPVSKEAMLLNFSLEMRREEDLGENEENQGGEGGDNEEEVCPAENGETEQGKDLLIVSMVKTSISVVAGRSCDTGIPCPGCVGTECTLNDVVMVSESSTVTIVSRGTFKKLKETNNAAVAHAASHLYLRAFCLQKSLYVSSDPERMTIYIYKSDTTSQPHKGLAVVLNFTDSNCFLRCCKDGERVLLRVETCEKQRLKEISTNDHCLLSFVFYMKSNRTKQRNFESALHLGWFIHLVNTNTVEMKPMEGYEEEATFVIAIQK